MSGENTITVTGNLTGDPEFRRIPGGSAVASFTIASTPRTFDRQKDDWVDGETLYLRASVWRGAAEHVAASLIKGDRVIASGVLKSRTFETKAGEKRTVTELEVEEIGASLRYSNAAVLRAGNHVQEEPNEYNDGGPDDTYRPIGSGPAPEFAADDVWFGTQTRANQEDRIHHPGPNGEPAYW